MEMKVTGEITKIMEAVEGGNWIKQNFIIDTGEEYNNILCFEVFGEEKVERLNQYNKVGDKVEISFNIRCNEHNGRYFTNLQAWKVWTVRDEAQDDRDAVVDQLEENEKPAPKKRKNVKSVDDLPF